MRISSVLSPDHLNARGNRASKTAESRLSYRAASIGDLPTTREPSTSLWSAERLFEHIGGLEAGLDFVVNAMEFLKPGGVAIHTTEVRLRVRDLFAVSPSISHFIGRATSRGADVDRLAEQETVSQGSTSPRVTI